MINLAKKEDTARLIGLWKDSFDDEAFAVKFYDGCIDYKNIFVYRNNENKIVAVLHLIPCCYIKGSEKMDGAYLYALSTDKEYRKKGIMGRLIERAIYEGQSRDYDFLYLIPADETLYEYYNRYGFDVIEDSYDVCGDCFTMEDVSLDMVKELAQKQYRFSNINLCFEHMITSYVIDEIESEDTKKFAKILIDGIEEGFIITCREKTYYGCNKDIFRTIWKNNNQKNGAILYLKDNVIESITGLIPY